VCDSFERMSRKPKHDHGPRHQVNPPVVNVGDQVGTLDELAHVIRVGGWRNVCVVGRGDVAPRVVKAIRNKVGRTHVRFDGVNELRDLVVLVNGALVPDDASVSPCCQVVAVHVPPGGCAVFWSSPVDFRQK